MKCVIKSCKSSNYRKNASCHVETFHKIPKDKILRNKWLKAINRNPEKFSVNAAICCSRHFESHCYINSLLFKRSKILKKNAVPTLFLDDEETSWKEGEKIQVLIHLITFHWKLSVYYRHFDLYLFYILINSRKMIPTHVIIYLHSSWFLRGLEIA